MGIFDQISDALSGKPAARPSQPASTPGSGPQNTGDDFSDLRRARNNEMARRGLNPDGTPMRKAAAPLPSMNDHADAMHPVKR